MKAQENEGEPDAEKGSQFQALVNAVSYVANEPFVLAQFEGTASPGKYRKLWPNGNNGEFNKRMDRVVEHLGGPLAAYLVREGQEPPTVDNFPEAALREVVEVFARARKSVLRADLFRLGSSLLTDIPDLIDFPNDQNGQQIFIRQTQAAFWEHAEAAYIRLSSFWDRVGQMLNFTFFNIRKFDHDGFNSVMDRIHANVVRMDSRLAKSKSWERLRAFQRSAKDDGLKWLIERRNLIVHSLHLHPVREEEEGVLKSQFNHLDDAHREKLRPREPAEEIELMIGQLNKAAELFSDFLAVVELSPSRKQSPFIS